MPAQRPPLNSTRGGQRARVDGGTAPAPGNISLGDMPARRSWMEVEKSSSYTPLLPKIGALLRYIVRCGDQSDTQSSPFSASSVAAVSIDDYLVRICKYSKVSPQVFPLLTLYMDRLLSYVRWELTSANVHRVIAAAFICTVKFHEDSFFSNKYYSTMLGLSVKDLNRMELRLLRLISWDMYVDQDRYSKFVLALQSYTEPPKKKSSDECKSDGSTPRELCDVTTMPCEPGMLIPTETADACATGGASGAATQWRNRAPPLSPPITHRPRAPLLSPQWVSAAPNNDKSLNPRVTVPSALSPHLP